LGHAVGKLFAHDRDSRRSGPVPRRKIAAAPERKPERREIAGANPANRGALTFALLGAAGDLEGIAPAIAAEREMCHQTGRGQAGQGFDFGEGIAVEAEELSRLRITLLGHDGVRRHHIARVEARIGAR
jgi:hypothetical protein